MKKRYRQTGLLACVMSIALCTFAFAPAAFASQSVASSLISVSPMAIAVDEAEPNDDFASASPIPLNSMVYGVTDSTSTRCRHRAGGPTGVDYYGCDVYKVTCPINGTLELSFYNGEYVNPTSSSYLYVSLFDSSYVCLDYVTAPLTNTKVVKTSQSVKSGQVLYLHVCSQWQAGALHPYHFKLAYQIAPTDMKSVGGTQKAFTAKWTKKSQASFYQVRYTPKSTYSDYGWSKAQVKKVSGKSGSVSIKNLKKRAKYLVQVRVARTIEGRTYYSAWSSRKGVTTK